MTTKYIVPGHGLQSGVPFSPPDPQLTKINIAEIGVGTSATASQSIPVGYASSWPVWFASPDGSSVTRVPDKAFSSNEGWVDPVSFEQLWLPMDLPPPTTSAALGLVLKDGVPRYVFPTMETVLATRDGGAWHNRGLNSLVIGKTWLNFRDVSMVEHLKFSCYHKSLPSDDDAKKQKKEEEATWTPAFPMVEVNAALKQLFHIIANGPDEMGQGFCYLITPLTSSSSSFLTKEAVVPGQRVRCFLSDGDQMPTSLNPDDDNAWLWKRGECDVTVHNVAPGGNSEYLPKVYKPLYEKEQCVE